MQGKFFAAIAVTAIALGVLIYSGVSSSSKAVVTVSQLMKESQPRTGLRLGARVASGDIDYQTTPEFLLHFIVTDPATHEGAIPVTYQGIMPDTLKVGRDVILEGDFDGTRFVAKTLLTQCPSKYKPPVPEGN